VRRQVRGCAAEDDRVDEQAVFVDQVLCDGGRGQARPADGHHTRTRPVTEPADLGGDVVGGQPRSACHRIQRPGRTPPSGSAAGSGRTLAPPRRTWSARRSLTPAFPGTGPGRIGVRRRGGSARCGSDTAPPSGAVQPMSPVGPAMKPSSDTLEEAYQGYLGQRQPISACGWIGSGHGHRGLCTRAGAGRR